MVETLKDFSRLCVHTITTKPWSLPEVIEGYTRADVPAVTVWRQALEPEGLDASAAMIRSSGLRVVSLCRGGFFPSQSPDGRQAAIDDNRRAVDEAAAIGAPLIVLVCGAEPGMPLCEARKQIVDGIAAVLPHAQAAGVKLSIEPLHPMYADSRSAVNTLAQANDMVEELACEWVGVTVDVYHLWWDPALRNEIARASDSILSFHVCDWRTPTRDLPERPRPHGGRMHQHPGNPFLGGAGGFCGSHRGGDLLGRILGPGSGNLPRTDRKRILGALLTRAT